ncbi:MAG TPA: hypothetical protein VE566_01510, partial [Nitrososphaeraceae archaeon]|nr:hypothetical protein [Nitrososphaeraceae archaeon]
MRPSEAMIDITASDEADNAAYNVTGENNAVSQTSSASPTVVDIEIQDIEGVGPTTARKLKEAG